MILDKLENVSLYRSLGPRFAAALDWLHGQDLRTITAGRHDIDGSDVYALVQENTTKPQEQGVWEAHRAYADVQCVVEGVERMGRVDIGDVKVTEQYNEKDDYLLGQATGSFFDVKPGGFVVFHPHDAHMPGAAAGAPAKVRKVVVKVRLG